MIETVGIYRSEPIVWADSHGGQNWSGTSVQFWRFFEGGRWLRCVSANQHLPFWAISEAQESEEKIVSGTYQVASDVLTITEPSPSPLGPRVLSYSWRIKENQLIAMAPEHPGHVSLSFLPITSAQAQPRAPAEVPEKPGTPLS